MTFETIIKGGRFFDGSGGPSAVQDAGVTSIAGALRLEFDDVRRLGPDVRLSAPVPHRPAARTTDSTDSQEA